MRPKVEAAIDFVHNGGPRAIITNPENLTRSRGETGTQIVPRHGVKDESVYYAISGIVLTAARRQRKESTAPTQDDKAYPCASTRV